MIVRFLLPARQELVDAIRYYNLQKDSLGDDFRDDALATTRRMAEFPLAWHPMSETIRRCQMRRFPYGLIYTPSEHEIIVLAVAHLHQEPNYWRSRM